MQTRTVDAIVIGAGIAGLAAAFQLAERGHSVAVFEASDRVGGVIRSENIDGYLVEWGPNTVRVGTGAAWALGERVGLGDERVLPAPAAKRRYIVHPKTKRLVAVRPGPSIMLSPLLGVYTKWRLATEWLRRRLQPHHRTADATATSHAHPTTATTITDTLRLPPNHPDDASGSSGVDETIAQFVTRRISREFADHLIAPMVSGIFAGDIDKLSLRAVFPRMHELEMRYGSLLGGALAMARTKLWSRHRFARSAATPNTTFPAGKLFTFRRGFSSLAEALGARLGPTLRLSSRVDALTRNGATGAFEVRVRHADAPVGGPAEVWSATAVIMAVPAPVASRLIAELEPPVAEALAEIRYAPMAVVALGFPKTAIRHPLDGFGCLIPRISGIETLGSLWPSAIFAGRAPAGHALIAGFIGGSTNPTAVERSEEWLIERVVADLSGLLGIVGAPAFAQVRRHLTAIPQYEIGHLDRLRDIDTAEYRRPGLAFVGNYLRGIGVNDVVAYAQSKADAISEHISKARSLILEPLVLTAISRTTAISTPLPTPTTPDTDSAPDSAPAPASDSAP